MKTILIRQTIKSVSNIDAIYDVIYEGKAKPIKIISKYNWYELGEKSTKFLLNVEKH